MRNWTAEELTAFETKIAGRFNNGDIRAPVHLSDGSENQLISIFKEVKDEDWVFCSWRSHYQCLLKGVSPDTLEDAILKGRSIALCFPEKNIYSSALVGGQLPLAIGVAMSIKRTGLNQKVWCFLGDMTSETGMAQSSIRYAEAQDLPIEFIIEDNGSSVCTNTRQTWGSDTLRYQERVSKKVRAYFYKSKYPHAGAGVRVQF